GAVEHGAADQGGDVEGGEERIGVVQFAAADTLGDDVLDEIGELAALVVPAGIRHRGSAYRAHQFPELRVVKGEIDHSFHDATEAHPSWGMIILKLLFEPVDQAGESAVEDGEVEVFLALEIDVECSLADAGGGGYVVEADLM